MAGPLSPVIPEADVRQFPVGGYRDNSLNYLSRQITNIGQSAIDVADDISEADNWAPLAKKGQEFIKRASQTNDLTGRSVVPESQIRGTAANLVAEAYTVGIEEGRAMSGMLSSSLGETYGVSFEDPIQAQRDSFVAAAADRGFATLGPEVDEMTAVQEGARQIALEVEMDNAKDRIGLINDQMALDANNRSLYKEQVMQEAGRVTSQVVASALNPFFTQLMESDLQDPAMIAQNRNNLLQSKQQVMAALQADYNEMGVDFEVQADLMQAVNAQFDDMMDGVEIMANTPAEVLEAMRVRNTLTEIATGSSLGKMIGIFGTSNTSAYLASAGVQDPAIMANLGKDILRLANPEERFNFRQQQIGAAIQAQDLSNPEVVVDGASKILTGDITDSNDPRDIEMYGHSASTLVRAALGADFDSQVNAVEILANPTTLEGIKKGSAKAITDTGIFLQDMATRMNTMALQIAEQVDGISVEYDSKGRIIPDYDGWQAALERVGDAFADGPSGPFGINSSIRGGAQAYVEITNFNQFRQLESMVETYNKAVEGLETLAPSIPRGLRNNNPGNIRGSATNSNTFVDETTGSDPEFETFRNPQAGVRAMGIIISTNEARGMTVSEFISRYAPPTENNTQAYIDNLQGIDPNAPLSEVDKVALVRQMIRQENGFNPFSDEFIERSLGE
jgi:hypothetical protein